MHSCDATLSALATAVSFEERAAPSSAARVGHETFL